MKRRPWPARLARAALAALASFAALSILAVALFRFVPVPVTAFMLHDDEPVRGHDWVPWEQIPRHAALAVIAAEDQKFLEHDGFDFEAIDRALTDARRGRRLRGASTISQQVAKNLFLWPGKSWARKGLEAWFTLCIETLWPKRRILEVYLNSAEFGRGIWGVEAASRHYFGKPAARITRAEAALLAAVLPNPRRYRVVNPGPVVRERQQWILGQMRGLGGTRLLDGLD
jgi:monofunctional biosynthetic peptidoglycan transglycosylase